jgi:hypothetical protein
MKMDWFIAWFVSQDIICLREDVSSLAKQITLVAMDNAFLVWLLVRSVQGKETVSAACQDWHTCSTRLV